MEPLHRHGQPRGPTTALLRKPVDELHVSYLLNQPGLPGVDLRDHLVGLDSSGVYSCPGVDQLETQLLHEPAQVGDRVFMQGSKDRPPVLGL